MNQKFTIEDGLLLRAVFPDRGQPYVHRCELKTFKEVCHAIDGLEEWEGLFSGEEIMEPAGLPSTQTFTAIAFLKERGCIVPAQRRKHKVATTDVYMDGMIEWKALEEGSVSLQVLPLDPEMESPNDS